MASGLLCSRAQRPAWPVRDSPSPVPVRVLDLHKPKGSPTHELAAMGRAAPLEAGHYSGPFGQLAMRMVPLIAHPMKSVIQK